MHDHSSPYIESTTVLSDNYIHVYNYNYIFMLCVLKLMIIIKGNVAAYKDLNLVTVTIKRYFSREHSERM